MSRTAKEKVQENRRVRKLWKKRTLRDNEADIKNLDCPFSEFDSMCKYWIASRKFCNAINHGILKDDSCDHLKDQNVGGPWGPAKFSRLERSVGIGGDGLK
jgi:hypothetical protein